MRLNDLDAAVQLVDEAILARQGIAKYVRYATTYGMTPSKVARLMIGSDDTLHDKCYGQNLLDVLEHCNLFSRWSYD